jgi:oligopeptide transport system permease protein
LLRYALKRLLGAIPTLLLVIVLAFLMVRAAPGGPFDDERVLPPDTRAALEAAYSLDEPLHRQFLDYLGGLLEGDLGPSYHYRDHTVGDLIGSAFPVSLQLGALAMLLAVVVGVLAGTVAALRRNSWLDRAVMAFAMTGISIPVFVIAPVLVLLLAVRLQWLPAGWSGNEGFGRLVLPVVALALPQIAYIARLTLHSHGAGAGPRYRRYRSLPCSQACDVAGAFLPGPGDRGGTDRLGRCRGDLRHSGPRSVFRARCAQP